MIFVPGNTPSSKNSKVKTGRGIFPSGTVSKYLRNLGVKNYSASKKKVNNYINRPNKFKDLKEEWIEMLGEEHRLPLIVQFHFVRATKHKFDFHNVVQLIADLLVAHDFISDDNMDEFIPVPFRIDGKWYSYDKENPGCYVLVK